MKEKGPMGWFKKRAKEMSRQDGISHMTALQKIAVAVGFQSWNEMRDASHERLVEALQRAKSVSR